MVYRSGQIFLPFCHNTRVWQTDGRRDGQTDRQTDRILIARPRLHCMQRGNKTEQNRRPTIRTSAHSTGDTEWQRPSDIFWRSGPVCASIQLAADSMYEPGTAAENALLRPGSLTRPPGIPVRDLELRTPKIPGGNSWKFWRTVSYFLIS